MKYLILLVALVLVGCATAPCKCGCTKCEDGCTCSPEKDCGDVNCHCKS
jgi:hypothetical protein